jgi:hypothetical protein
MELLLDSMEREEEKGIVYGWLIIGTAIGASTALHIKV